MQCCTLFCAKLWNCYNNKKKRVTVTKTMKTLKYVSIDINSSLCSMLIFLCMYIIFVYISHVQIICFLNLWQIEHRCLSHQSSEFVLMLCTWFECRLWIYVVYNWMRDDSNTSNTSTRKITHWNTTWGCVIDDYDDEDDDANGIGVSETTSESAHNTYFTEIGSTYKNIMEHWEHKHIAYAFQLIFPLTLLQYTFHFSSFDVRCERVFVLYQGCYCFYFCFDFFWGYSRAHSLTHYDAISLFLLQYFSHQSLCLSTSN